MQSLILLVAILGVALAGLAAPALAERVALVIGNGAYRYANPLANPPQDAAAMAGKLAALGFRVVEANDADLGAMRAALADFGEQARGAEAAVIFYAGHGLQVDGENYLIPVDGRIAGRDDLPREAVRTSDFYAQLLHAAPELAVVILDACRDNPFVSAVSTSAGLSTGNTTASAFVQRPHNAGMLIGFAAAPGAVAFDGGDGNSPYTTALLRWIDRPGLEIGALFRRVRGTVIELTGGAQVPWVEEALLRDSFLVPPVAGSASDADEGESAEVSLLKTIRALDTPLEQTAAMEFYARVTGDSPKPSVDGAAAGGPADEDFVRQGLIWLSIRRSSDIGLLESFLQTFPESRFADLARQQIDELQAEPVQLTAAEVAPVVVQDPVSVAAPTTTRPATPDPVVAEPSDGAELLDLRARLKPATPALAEAPATEIAPATPAAPDPAAGEADLGLSPAQFAAVQSLLAQAGEYRGPADAIFGPGTRRAIARVQTGAGLFGTGYLDPATLRALVDRSAGLLLRAEADAARREAVQGVAAVALRGPGAEAVVLRVATISRNDEVEAYWDEVARGFEADHPGTRVVFDHQPGGQYKANLLAMLGSATPPAIMHTWGGGHLDALRDAGFARELSAAMADGWALEFRPSALRNYTRAGRIYGAPTEVALVSLWVNAPLLKRAGISLEELRTWDGFLSAARALKVQGIVPIAVGGKDKWPFQMIWGNLAQQLGGRAAFEEAYAEPDGFRAPAFVEAGEQLRALAALNPFQDGFLEMSEAEAGNAFAKGETAMVITGNWRIGSMGWNWPGGPERMRTEIRRLDFPELPGPGDGLETYGGVDGYVVNPAAPAVALDLLRVLTSREVLAHTAELSTVVPSVTGADLAIVDPVLADVAATLLESSYHQLYYDQVLGPVAGAVLNEVTLELATGAVSGAEAADEIDRAWDAARLDVTTPELAIPAR